QRNRVERLWESSPLGLIAVDVKGKVIQFSKKAQQIMGYNEAEVIGADVQRLYGRPGEARRIGSLLYRSPNHRLLNEPSSVAAKNGELIPVRLSATWLEDATETYLGSVGYFEDLRLAQEADRRQALLLQASNVIAKARTVEEGLRQLASMVVFLLNKAFC